MRTNAAAGAALASALTAAAGASDGPGGVVYPNWGPLQELTWQRNVRSLGTVAALASGDSSSAPIPVILADGSLRVHPPGRFAPFGLPVPGDLGAVRWAGVTTGEWFLAITESGALRQWSANGPGFAPADASWRFIALGRSNPVGVTGDGTMRAWSFAGPLAIEGAVAGPVSLGAGDRWGMSVDALGVARPFALGGAAVPGIPATAGARSVAVDPLAEAASVAAQVDPGSSAVILRNDGSLTTASGISLGAGPYSQVAWSGNAETRVVALRTDGRAEVVAASGVEVTVPGCYREVWGARGSLSAYGAVWNDDCDRDGEPDAAQIVRGELPDANGDLVDDRRQSPFVLPDLNANGIPDHAETGTDTKLCARTTLTYHLLFQGGGNPAPVREVWAAATRIREGGEVVDRVTWLAARPTVAAQYAFQPIPAVLHVWSDPDGDGLPHDAVEILAVPTTLRVGMNTIDFPPVRIGERGESVFVGLTWVRPAGLVYGAGMGCWQRTSPVAGDPVAASRLQGALRVGSSPDLSRSPTDILRGDFGSATQSPEVGGSGTLGIGFIPYVALGSVRALPTDCDRNGIVDAVELADAYWAPRIDADGDGRIDACESDCDGDGTQDLDAVLAGAEDCDRDLVPDACAWGKGGAPDCDGDGTPDACQGDDCDGNGVPDACDLAAGAPDADGDGTLDACQRDCDGDGTPDHAQIAAGASDCNGNGWIDACESNDCDGDGTTDACEVLERGDCNRNGIPDDCDLASGIAAWRDLDEDGVIDACQNAFGADTDCDRNGAVDQAEMASDPALDSDADRRLDRCERAVGDLNLDGSINALDLGILLGLWGDSDPEAGDFDGNGIVDGGDLGFLLGNWGPVRW